MLRRILTSRLVAAASVLVPVVALAAEGPSHDHAAHMQMMKGSSCTCAPSATTTDEARALAGKRLPSEASIGSLPSIPGTTDQARLIAGSQLPRSERSAPGSIPVISTTDEARAVAAGQLAVRPASARHTVAGGLAARPASARQTVAMRSQKCTCGGAGGQ